MYRASQHQRNNRLPVSEVDCGVTVMLTAGDTIIPTGALRLFAITFVLADSTSSVHFSGYRARFEAEASISPQQSNRNLTAFSRISRQRGYTSYHVIKSAFTIKPLFCRRSRTPGATGHHDHFTAFINRKPGKIPQRLESSSRATEAGIHTGGVSV